MTHVYPPAVPWRADADRCWLLSALPSFPLNFRENNVMPVLESWMAVLATCTLLGAALGAIRFGHFSLGSSAILFSSMALGAAGASLPASIRELGLMLFIYAVGSETGGGFLAALLCHGPRLAIVAAATVVTGFTVAVIYGLVMSLPPAAIAGMFGGALTSTPALATAMDGLLPNDMAVLSFSYGLAYPAGIIGVVVFVQLIGKLEHISIAKEECVLAASERSKELPQNANSAKESPLPVFVVMGAGYLLGQMPCPFPGHSQVTLGSAGGVLLCSILVAGKGSIRNFPLVPAPELRSFLREFGLYAFLAGVGVQTGQLLDAETLRAGLPVLGGSLLTVSIPMLLCWYLGRKVFRMDFLPMLGAVAGSMTSTPGLAAATSVSLHKSIVQSYATVYPVALLSMIIMIKVLYLMIVPQLFL